MACKFIYKEKSYTESELTEVLKNDPKVISQVRRLARESEDDIIDLGKKENKYIGNKVAKSELLNLNKRLGKDGKKAESEIEKLYTEIVARVRNVHAIYADSLLEDDHVNVEKINNLKDALKKLALIDKVKGIKDFVRWSSIELATLEDRVDKALKSKSISDNLIMSIKEWNGLFDLMDGIEQLIKSSVTSGDLDVRLSKPYEEIITDIRKRSRKIDSKMLDVQRMSYAKQMSKDNKKMTATYRDLFAKEYKEKEELGDILPPINEYIATNMHESKDLIENAAYEEALSQSIESDSDITMLAAVMFSEKNTNSRDIQAVSDAIQQTEFIIANFAQNRTAEFKRKYDEYVEKYGRSMNQRKMFGDLIDVTEKGKSYYAGKYKADFYEKLTEARSAAHDVDIFSSLYDDIEITDDLKYTLEGESERRIFIKGAEKIKKHGSDIQYLVKGEWYNMTRRQAIGHSELGKWIGKNTVIAEHAETRRIPNDNWLNKEYAELGDKLEFLNFFKDNLKAADKSYDGKKSLIRNYGKTEFIRLQGMLKTDRSRMAEGQIVEFAERKGKEITKKQEDDDETRSGTGRKLKDSIRTMVDVSNRERMKIPISLRANLDYKDQSFDLFTMGLDDSVRGENYKRKKEIEASMLVILEVMKNRNVPQTSGISQKKKIHQLSEEEEAKVFKPKNELTNDVKKLMSVLENRLYGIKSRDAGSINVFGKKADVNQLTKTYLKYSGMVALLGNLPNSIINYTMGSTSNLIEAIGGEHFNLRDLMYANKAYLRDLPGILNDMGTHVDTSVTNRLMNVLNVMGSKEYLDSNFESPNRFTSLLKMNTLRPLAKAGEHMMQSKIMYATLRSIRVTNAKGEWLDKDGNVVKSKRKAASLNEMITFVEVGRGGIKMVLDPSVKATSFTPEGGNQDKLILDAMNLIKNKIIELQGLYDSDLQALAQMEFYGKLGFFLRKWIIPGYFRRWRGMLKMFKTNEEMKDADKFFSNDAKSNREGYYVTAIRFITRTMPMALKEAGFEGMKAEMRGMSGMEKANLRKVMADVVIMMIGIMIYEGFGDEDEEDKAFYKYLARRQISEMMFFVLPPEALKIASTPTAAIGVFKNMSDLMIQSFSFGEEYEQGRHKGEKKWAVKRDKLIPIWNKLDIDFTERTKWLNTASGFN